VTDTVELARSIQTLQYGEWTDVIDGNLFVACGQCGMSHHHMYRFTGPNMLRVRVDFDETLTQATREYNDHPLYKEVLALREENAQLRRRVAQALERCNDPHYHSDIEEALRADERKGSPVDPTDQR
jgi:hypothetical protein